MGLAVTLFTGFESVTPSNENKERQDPRQARSTTLCGLFYSA